MDQFNAAKSCLNSQGGSSLEEWRDDINPLYGILPNPHYF